MNDEALPAWIPVVLLLIVELWIAATVAAPVFTPTPLIANNDDSIATAALPVPVTNVFRPLPELLRKLEFQIASFSAPEAFSTETPCCEKFAQPISSSTTLAAETIRTQLSPLPAPLIDIPRS